MFLKPAFPVLNRSHWQADSLLGAWLLSESGGTDTYDASESGAVGSLTGIASWGATAGQPYESHWTTGQTGSSVFCGGNSNLGAINTNVSYSPRFAESGTRFSLSVIFRAAALQDSQLIGERSGGGYALSITSGGALQAGGLFGVIGGTNVGAGVYTPGRWCHAVQVYDAVRGVCEIYLDGRKVASISRSQQIRLATSTTSIGENWGNGGNGWFHGDIESAQVWNRPLSSREVSDLHHDPYAAFRPRTARRFFQAFESPAFALPHRADIRFDLADSRLAYQLTDAKMNYDLADARLRYDLVDT